MQAELAIPDEELEPDESTSTFLAFDLGGLTLGISVKPVREILDLKPLTPLPNAPHDVLGVVDVRGASIPILDLTSRLGMHPADAGPESRIVVFEIAEGHDIQAVGFLADRVRDVRRIDPAKIEPASRTGASGVPLPLIHGLWRQNDILVALLDLEHLM